jgi:hypothetical protein
MDTVGVAVLDISGTFSGQALRFLMLQLIG